MPKPNKTKPIKLVGAPRVHRGKRSTPDNPIACDHCGEIIDGLPYYAIHSRTCSRECQRKVFRGEPSKVKRTRRVSR